MASHSTLVLHSVFGFTTVREEAHLLKRVHTLLLSEWTDDLRVVDVIVFQVLGLFNVYIGDLKLLQLLKETNYIH